MAPLGRAAPELVGARVAIAEPGAGHEVGGRLLVGLEVAVEGEEDEDVLLRVRPAAGRAVGEQALHELGDEVALRRVRDERLEQDRVGAPVGVEQQVRAVAVGDGEVGRARGLRRRCWRGGGGWPRPRPTRPRPSRGPAGPSRAPRTTGPRHRPRARGPARPRGVAVAHQRPHGERVGLERAAHVLPVLGRDVPVDLAQVAPRALEGVVGHGEALRLRAGEGVGHVDRDVGPGLVAPAPEAEAAVVVLQRAQAVEVALHRRLDLVGLRQALGLEGGRARRGEPPPRGRARRAARRTRRGRRRGRGRRR